MTALIAIVTLAALWSVIELCAWGASEAESDENRRVAKGRGVMMVFGVIALCLWGLSASASTVHGYLGLVWSAEGFRPVTGPDVFKDGKSPCPRVGPSWKDPRTDEVMRERRCSPPPDAGIRWAAPLGLGPAPVIWHRSTSYGSTGGGGGFPPGGGGCCCGCGGSHTDDTPEDTPAPIPLPWPGAMLVAALGGLVMMRGRST